jgi:cytochrome c oxidase subunit 4
MAHDHHIIPLPVLLKVFGSLIVLTGITYGVAQIPLGPLDVPVAIAIAAVKATLVVLFFMALKYDNPVNTLTFTVGTIFVLVFITFTLFDTAFRGDLGNVSERTKAEIDRAEEEAMQQQEQIPAEQLRVAPGDYESDTTDTSGSDASN